MYYNESTLVFLDGQWLHPKSLDCSLYSQTLHYGIGVFEGIRAYKTPRGAKIYRGRAHYERLLDSCKKMHIKLDYTVDQLMDLTYELLQKNGLEDAYIRPLVYQGDSMALAPIEETHLFIATWEWGRYLGDSLLKVKTSSYQRPNPKSTHMEAKTCGHYVNSLLATKEAKSEGFNEALLTDMNGNVAEGSSANFFFEKDGVLYTPPLGHILPGITRQAILDLAAANGIKVEQKFFTLDEVKQADSAFFTGTAAEVAGAESLDDYQFPLSWKDSLGHRLSELYTEDVRRPETVEATS
ncbi:MAG: branched-chain amino acid transaminase [Candidatus Eremiobacteraeota bacterium]|nr:branched-chain amino acid transaminase [Candidatus Eremiobacteraeota bacterium]